MMIVTMNLPTIRNIMMIKIMIMILTVAYLVVEGFTTTTSTTKIWKLSASASTTTAASTASASIASIIDNLPDSEELSTAPFMKQVQYGSEMSNALHELTSVTSSITKKSNEEDDGTHSIEKQKNLTTMKNLLKAQLSHPDGIRGFMVAYLTSEHNLDVNNDANNDNGNDETDSEILLEALQGLLQNSNSEIEEEETENREEQSSDEMLVSLMCMNVVMPTAMISMHKDKNLSVASKVTSIRGTRLLKSAMKFSPSIETNVHALLEATAVATTTATQSSSSSSLIDYWNDFYEKWGYKDKQKEDIATAMKEILSSSSSSSSSSKL
mmetsp:Transcript_29014/g.31207  ORF Transcript_29014/g.31207 Transcript_29014/m.31207 type:complete len:325 (+) Transcript_29014:10-984(+)